MARLRDRLNKALRKESFEEALVIYDQLEAHEPTEPRWPHRKGDLLRRLGQSRDAIDAFSRAAQRYADLGFVARAVAVAKVVLQIDPGHREVLEAVDPAAARALRGEKRSRAKKPSIDEVPFLEIMKDASADSLVFAESGDEASAPFELSMSELEPMEPSDIVELDEDDIVLLDLEEEPRRVPAERLAAMPTMPLLAELPDPIRRELFAGAELVTRGSGELLVARGARADGIYLIVEGVAEVRVPGRSRPVLLGEGEIVGEGALLDDVERRADVAAHGHLQALFVAKSLLDTLVAKHAPLGDVLLDLMGRRQIANVLETSAVLGGFDGPTRAELAKLFELRRATAGTTLVEVGKRSDGLFVVLVGKLGNETGRLLTAGAALGQRSLITREPATSTWKAITDVLLLRVPAARFTLLAASFPPVLARLSELASGADDVLDGVDGPVPSLPPPMDDPSDAARSSEAAGPRSPRARETMTGPRRVRRHRRAPVSSGPPAFLLAEGRRRLETLAAALGTITTFTSVAFLSLGISSTRDLPTYVGVVVLSFGLWMAARSRVLSDARVVDLGLVAQVGYCGLIAIPPAYTMLANHGRVYDSLWTCILIVLFPLLAPSAPRRTLVVSVASAAMVPLGALLATHDAGAVDLRQAALLSVNPALCVIFAQLGARMLYRLGKEAEHGRRVGSYALLEPLGSGGMGEVWRAEHAMLSRPAAVKLIKARPGLAATPEVTLARFEREAQATATLRSPHTVEVYDFGRAEDGAFFYVMELLDGIDLERMVAAHGPLPPGRVVFLLEQACHSLAEAHGRGLVHRDIKPANLLVCRYGDDDDFVKVLDFGLVREEHPPAGAGDEGLTQDNRIVGTPAYLAPEAIAGTGIDARADLYALGCVAYWLLSGEHVFEGASAMAVAAKHLELAPERPSMKSGVALPPDLEALVMRCLEKDPAERPAGARALARALAACEVPPWTRDDARRWWDAHEGER